MAALMAGNAWAEIASGTWGNSTNGGTWSIDDDGVLTVSGQGKIPFANPVDIAPWTYRPMNGWGEYYQDIKSINISEGITEIGGQAFMGLTSATTLNLPSTLKTIGDGAFRYNSGLVEITFPENSQLTTIGNASFAACSNLESVALPQSLTSFGSNFFMSSKLKDVVIPDSLPLGQQAFFSTNLYNGHVYCSRAQEENCRNFLTGWDFCGSNSSCKNHYLNDVLRIYDVDKTCDGDGNCTYNSYTVNGETFTSYNDMVAALGFAVPAPKENRVVKNADGSYSVFDPNGNFIGFRGKRIYTVEEASRLSKPTGNIFKLRYK